MSNDKDQLPEWVNEIIAEHELLGDNGPVSWLSIESAIKQIYSRMQEENNKLREALEELRTVYVDETYSDGKPKAKIDKLLSLWENVGKLINKP